MGRQVGREGAGEAGVVETINAEGAGPVVLACEHASNIVPAEFTDLGLGAEALESHIAWDPGARAVALRLSALLDAPLVAQRVSRLVYDCNRPPHSADAMPAQSETYTIPGNAGLTAAERTRRAELYYEPFRAALAACLDARLAGTTAPALVTIHSFTPVYFGVPRDVGLGILHDRDRRLADILLTSLTGESGWIVRRNEPYGPEDGVTHTLADQALPRGLDNVMIEIRNDLIADAAGQEKVARLLARHLQKALAAPTGEMVAK